MSNLLRAGVRRYVRNIVFWLAIIATIVAAVICAVSTRQHYFDDFYCVIVFAALAVVISWLVGRENDEGIFRNKTVAGYTKGQIYISELILSVGTCVVMFLLFAIVFTAFNSYVFTKASLGACLGIFIDSLLVNICVAVILTTVSFLISKRYIVAIVNIVLVFAMFFASYAVQGIVVQDEYITEWDYEEVVVTDGPNTYVSFEPIEGSEHQVKNPRYIDGPLRTISETLYNIFPYGHITEYCSLTNDWFGYEYYELFPEANLTWETSDKDLTLSKEAMHDIYENLIWSVALNIAVCALGFIGFRKKELR